jgi:hypothetical protein
MLWEICCGKYVVENIFYNIMKIMKNMKIMKIMKIMKNMKIMKIMKIGLVGLPPKMPPCTGKILAQYGAYFRASGAYFISPELPLKSPIYRALHLGHTYTPPYF